VDQQRQRGRAAVVDGDVVAVDRDSPVGERGVGREDLAD
jgi:hypothetical protein